VAKLIIPGQEEAEIEQVVEELVARVNHITAALNKIIPIVHRQQLFIDELQALWEKANARESAGGSDGPDSSESTESGSRD